MRPGSREYDIFSMHSFELAIVSKFIHLLLILVSVRRWCASAMSLDFIFLFFVKL